MPDPKPSSAPHASILYGLEPGLALEEFVDVLKRSGLAERRPMDDPERLQRMLENADLIVTARDRSPDGKGSPKGKGRLVGVARSITDFAACCYLADLAVDDAYHGRGIGTELIRLTREACGQEGIRCVLYAAPKAVGFYRRLGLEHPPQAFDFTHCSLPPPSGKGK